jgi:hypothetical protein
LDQARAALALVQTPIPDAFWAERAAGVSPGKKVS